MTTDGQKGLRLSHGALPEMRARLALLNAAISALQRYQGNPEEGLRDDVCAAISAAGVRSKPFLVTRRDTHAEKAS